MGDRHEGCSWGAGDTPDLDVGGTATLWKSITMSTSGLHPVAHPVASALIGKTKNK